MQFLVPFIIIAHAANPVAQTSRLDGLQIDSRPQTMLIASEVFVDQEKGRILPKAKAPEPAGNQSKNAPEGATTAPQGSTNPTTCDAANASSPACYAATQQGRGK